MNEQIEVRWLEIQVMSPVGMPRAKDEMRNCVFPSWASAMVYASEILERGKSSGLVSFRLLSIQAVEE